LFFVYGSQQDVENILNQATIAVLSSQSEGLPIVLEYGLHKRPVVVTAVGDMPMIINNE
jgi:glycosyltransferase involved in cell wall biosynthesis